MQSENDDLLDDKAGGRVTWGRGKGGKDHPVSLHRIDWG